MTRTTFIESGFGIRDSGFGIWEPAFWFGFTPPATSGSRKTSREPVKNLSDPGCESKYYRNPIRGCEPQARSKFELRFAFGL